MYEYTKDMKSISGMSIYYADYEKACQTMLIASLEYLDKNPELNPIFAYYGDENKDAKEVMQVMVDSVNNDPTGAMIQIVSGVVMFIKEHSWDEFVKIKTHPGGEMGILKDEIVESHERITTLTELYEGELVQNRMQLETIAKYAFKWKEYKISKSSDQKAYAPNKKKLAEIKLGDSVTKLIEQEILKRYNHKKELDTA